MTTDIDPPVIRKPDHLPRYFQANLDRFYRRVVLPSLGELRIHDNVKYGTMDLAEFMENAEKATDNDLAWDARRVFALALGSVFQRQLRIWGREHFPEAKHPWVANSPFDPLLLATAELHGIDLVTRDLGVALGELNLLGSAVRHGDGASTEKLRKAAPDLWHHVPDATQDALSDNGVLSEAIQVRDQDFLRYARATLRFWGLADREMGAVIDPPY